MKSIPTLIFCALTSLLPFQKLGAQEYTTARAHSHNDYEQANPFWLAFIENYGSIEADIHLLNGELYVSHDAKAIRADRTLKHLYLDPLNSVQPTYRKLQLLIDVKTEAIATLDTLVSVLKRYPAIIQNSSITIVISGNRPLEESYSKYPSFIWMDGRPGINYSKEALSRVALISASIQQYTGVTWPPNKQADSLIRKAISDAHALGKPIRFWATPDSWDAWNRLVNWGVDYINTDHLVELRQYLQHISSQ
ncbi:MAG: alkaline phosphatase [Chitinophagia bacterium]|nr:alkaline phosphatase [Chitinophagia bacterium]